MLDLNDTQTSILSLVFRYCDDQHLPLLDLADLRDDAQVPRLRRRQAGARGPRRDRPASLGVILRAIVTLEQEGAGGFFGEPEFDPDDLIRTTADGKGIVTLLEVADVMDRPRLYSTFVLWMLAQLYETLPEVGDIPKPKLAFFFDEAHLLFKDASKPLLEQIERTARLIRSKGVGVYFVTQAPTDVPSSVLSQLGNRVQHALRAFTPDDADALRKTARTFPMTTHYDVERTITTLGIGEALVTVLSPKGIPTPLAATRLVPPDSRMAPLTRRGDRGVRRRVHARRPLQPAGRPAERARDHHRPARQREGGRRERARRRRRCATASSPTTADGLADDDARRAAARDQAAGEGARRPPSGPRSASGRPRRRRPRRRRSSASGCSRPRSGPPARSRPRRPASPILRGVFDVFFGGGKSR